MKASPWQYPTSGSNLNVQVSMVTSTHVTKDILQAVSLENIKQVLLPYPFALSKESMMRECPAKITHNSLLVGARLF